MIRLYCIGIGILFTAIIANWSIGKIGGKSWYDFFQLMGNQQLNQLRFMDYLWLFLMYPLVLGLGGQMGIFIYQKILNSI